MTAYDPAQWSDMFVAVAGASAALLGLLFVAVSINLERILQFEGLPERALETMMLLLGALVVSIVGLAPAQSALALGLELLGVGLAMAAVAMRLPISRDDGSGEAPALWIAGRWGIRVAGTVPFVLAGASLALESGGGLYWVVAGFVFAISGAVASAWVLMVEILR